MHAETPMANIFAGSSTGRSTDSNKDKFVFIRRTTSFLESAQIGSKELFTEARVSVGPYWRSSTSPAIATGLDPNEIKLLLPRILNIAAEDRDFNQAVNEFYKELRTEVPHGEGTKLNIGLVADNDKPVAEDNLPLELMDYLRYRHVRKHPFVAPDMDSGLAFVKYRFYMHDPEEANTLQRKANEAADKAMTIFLSIKNSPRVDMILTIMNIDPVAIANKNPSNARAEKDAALRKVATDNPMEFMRIYEIDNFEERYLAFALLHGAILKRIGDAFVDTSNNDALANNVDEMIMWLKQPQNTNRIMMYKTKLQQRLNGPVLTLPKKIVDTPEAPAPKAPAKAEKPVEKATE